MFLKKLLISIVEKDMTPIYSSILPNEANYAKANVCFTSSRPYSVAIARGLSIKYAFESLSNFRRPNMFTSSDIFTLLLKTEYMLNHALGFNTLLKKIITL